MGKEGSRRKHDAEFKREAVRLIVERGLSVKKVAEDLGIHPNMLGNWKRQYLRDQEGSFNEKGHVRPEDKELLRLKRENADLREERDIV